MKRIITAILLISVLFVLVINGCKSETDQNDRNEITGGATVAHVVKKCQLLCQEAKNSGQDLSNGPCLSDGKPFAADWVCDVAHEPRAEVDNQRENQCSEFHEGKARHFVEVDEECELIKSY